MSKNVKSDRELMLVLTGDTSSIQTGAENILLDHDEQTKFSFKMYDLCGQHISIINLLGQQNAEKIPLNQGIDAFLLLIPNGLHNSHYESGVKWLEQTFGRQSLAHLMTVVTYNSGEKCEDTLKDLKAIESFDEKRFHTCTRSMTEGGDIADLVEKINIMASGNSPFYNRQMCTENTEQNKHLEPKSLEEMDDSALKENQTGTSMEKLDGHKEKQSAEISDKVIQQTHQEEIEALFARLHLQDKFQHKLTKNDFLQISEPIKPHHDTFEKDLAHSFLQRLIMLDYRARCIPVKQDSPEVTHPVYVSERDENDMESFFCSNVKTKQLEQTHVHPMDVQMAVFHCSDNFLRQIMITKLSECQYALPLLVPDPFTMEIECPLWAFRQITKTWKVTKSDSSTIIKTVPIYKAETPLVSFFHLGSSSVSKSQLMSSLINDRHSTFFHRNCKGSTRSRHLLDGVAEIAWYCPADNPDDAFSDCIAFCNLHGDAVMLEKQRDLLIEKSSVNVVLVSNLQKDDKSWPIISSLFKSKTPLICLIADDNCATEFRNGKYKMGLKEKSLPNVSEELKKIIREVLSSEDCMTLKTLFKLETMTDVSGIKVDESDLICQKSKSSAMKIYGLLQNKEVSKIKDEFLPCQGDLWYEWCKINKELYHLKGHFEKEKSEKERKLMEIRRVQCFNPCSDLMKCFTESLSSLQDKEYFLKWTQILTDAISTNNISQILQEYNSMWSEVLALKTKHNKSEASESKKHELEFLSKKLQSATFGLEHIFREMGQIYEAHKTIDPQSTQSEWCKYPELAADLLISGHPLELLDGDAGHVPLEWISSVLKAVTDKLGDQKVFVLSVLGLQSSGKSTMLNAMFGLQFAVSSGRCTKGAFMHLITISDEKRKDFEFGYVLVVDTEGLRALELGDKAILCHDNELATFVVGVGNMTLINIFGENPSEMQDILQIVVQAFMRMKKVKLTPSCVFVHQNVTDVAAAERTMDGKRRLQEKLDQTTQLAAKEEDYEADCFSDVIKFDVQTDVKYLAQLWEGSPPMAPPNPGYSESIQELKNIVLSKASESKGISLSQLNTNIQEVWKALLQENFVFSFKNTLEIAVYRKLEAQYGNWTWAIRSNLLTIENQLYNRIENGNLNKVESSYLTNETSKTYEEIQAAMKTYFEDDKEKEILVQWRGQFENKIKEFRDEQVKVVQKKLEQVIEQKDAQKKMDDMKTVFENKLLQKSKELAHQLKDKAKDEKELQKHFSSVWRTWVHELTRDVESFEDINLEEDLSAILTELGIEDKLIQECRTSEKKYKNLTKIGNYTDYISPKSTHLNKNNGQLDNGEKEKGESKKQGYKGEFFFQILNYAWSKLYPSFPHQQNQQISKLTDKLAEESLSSLTEKPVASRGYRSVYLQEMAKGVKKEVETFELTNQIYLKKEFTLDLILYVFDSAKSWLLESQEEFIENNDVFIYLENKKMHYYNIFKILCKGSSSAVVLGELISEKLKASIAEAVSTKTALTLAGEMKCNLPAFNGNRLNLEKHVLKSLAVKEDFASFIRYIRTPKIQTEAFIRAEVQKYIYKDHTQKAENTFNKTLEDINTLVSQALFNATHEVKNKNGNANMWLNALSSQLKDELKFDSTCFQNFNDIKDFDFLMKEVNEKLESIKQQISKSSLNEREKARKNPEEILIDQLCKCCWVTCPFCSAVCTNTIENHSSDDHSVPFHRPSGIKGMHFRNTNILCVNFCTTNVASDGGFYPRHDSEKSIPFKQYRTAGPKYASWKITADESKLSYWKWFVCRFKEQLENHYSREFKEQGEIPQDWNEISKEEAIRSLDDM